MINSYALAGCRFPNSRDAGLRQEMIPRILGTLFQLLIWPYLVFFEIVIMGALALAWFLLSLSDSWPRRAVGLSGGLGLAAMMLSLAVR